MRIEEFDPAADDGKVNACYQMYVAGLPVDDPDGPPVPEPLTPWFSYVLLTGRAMEILVFGAQEIFFFFFFFFCVYWFSILLRFVPGIAGCRKQIIRALPLVDSRRVNFKAFIVFGRIIGRIAMIAHYAQHVGFIFFVASECAQFAGHFCRGGIGSTGHNSGDRTADGTCFFAVVRYAV